jgi:hypothetical protein
MTATRPAALALVAALVAGCATTLKPAPEATTVGGPGQNAVGAAAGVRVVARAEAWHGEPAALDSIVTPILVTIENDSPHPLRVRYEQFTFVTADGRRLAARGPYDITGVVSEPAASPPPILGPGIVGFVRGRPVYIDPFYDPFFYGRWSFYPVQLPTGDMVQFALPQQTLARGGRVSGFVYFERVERAARRVALTFDLVDADTGQRFGTVSIPFVVS